MVNIKVTTRLLFIPILWMGCVQLAFAFISLFIFHDHLVGKFVIPAASMLFTGLAIFFLFRKVDFTRASYKDALIYATATWVVAGVLGGIPIIEITQISFTDAVFESISALTTTGATMLSGLDAMPKTFLLYRQFLQWMGGLGIVIFVVAILPMLNVGGMKLLKAETPGPIKDDKLSPRVANTAHYLWGVYIFITLACTLAYYLAGMSFFDAVAHSFTTVSTGGFSTHDASMWYFESHSILMISNIFMLLGAINFGLHFRVVYKRSLKGYYLDEETRYFILIVLFISLALGVYLFKTDTYANFLESLSFSAFHLVSFITSTGYAAGNYSQWPAAAAYILVFAGYLGGCAGSTAGGNKIIRDIMAVKLINKNLNQLIHPQGVFVIKYQNQTVHTDVRNAVMAFLSFVSGSSLAITLILMATGLDFWSAFTAVAACINVSGPGFGALSSNFQPVSDLGTWVLSGAMILGRLEYFTVFALLLPSFWKN